MTSQKPAKSQDAPIARYTVAPGRSSQITVKTLPDEASALDYTILRPAWLTDEDEVDYETTERNEPFKGTEVSRKSVADLIVKLIESPKRSMRATWE